LAPSKLTCIKYKYKAAGQSLNCTGSDNLSKTIKRLFTQRTQNYNAKGALEHSTTDTLQKPRLRDRKDRAWFSRLVRHSDRKLSGSILTTPEPGREQVAFMNSSSSQDEISRTPQCI